MLEVKLKPLWGTRNVGGFDYRRWLVAKGYRATGYIQHGSAGELRASVAPAHFVRKRLLESGFSQAPGLLALAVGDQDGLTTAHWARLRKTGTIHLFVISGLHVALVGGWLYLLLLFLFRLFAVFASKSIPAHKIAMLLSLVGVFGYGWVWVESAGSTSSGYGWFGYFGAFDVAPCHTVKNPTCYV